MTKKDWIIGTGVLLALILALVGVGGNDQSSLNGKIDNLGVRIQAQIQALSGEIASLGQAQLGAGTRFANGLSADSTSPIAGEVRGTTLTVTATSTVQEVTYGSRFSKALTFTAGATTTSGGLFALQNTGETKICGKVELSVTTASALGGKLGVGDAFAFSVGTSTSATQSTGNGRSILASTTLATTTTLLMDSVKSPGAGVAVLDQSWLWTMGDYILGQFDDYNKSSVGGTPNATSSIPYTSMVGKVYVTCHTR